MDRYQNIVVQKQQNLENNRVGERSGSNVNDYKVMWILWTVLIVMVTTVPWSDFHVQFDQRRLNWIAWLPFHGARWSKRWALDIVINLFLFIPFSYLFLRSQVRDGMQGLITVMAATVLLSVAIEYAQVFNTSRVPSMGDVATNIIGACMGVALFLVLRRKHQRG
jgi:glycopeptide antibiotics resistance protein